jgi:hypothetical protein
VRIRILGAVAIGALLLTGCGTGTGESAPTHSEQLTLQACQDIVSVMAPKQGTAVVTWNASDLSQSPIQRLIRAVRRAPNAKLHSEAAAFESAASGELALAHPNDSVFRDANAMVQTCKQLGLPASAR